jgi:nucleolin
MIPKNNLTKKKLKKTQKNKTQNNKDSDDDSNDESEKIQKKKGQKDSKKEEDTKDKPKKQAKKKAQKDDSDSEKEQKQVAEKEKSEDSDKDSSDINEKSKEKKQGKKSEKNIEESNDSDSESEANKKTRAKATAKKEEVSDEEEEKEEKEEKNSNEDQELPSNAFEELFVKNISFNTTEKELAEAFQKYGDVEESKIVTDKQTGKSRGFGFLKFYSKKSAVEAMNDADNITVGGRNLLIRYSNDKNSDFKGSGSNNTGKKGPSSEFGIFVGNISYKCTENDLKKFFKDCGKVLDVRLAKKPDGKLKGFAHVDFENKEAMEKAVEKNGQEMQGRALKIDKSSRKTGSNGNGNRGGQGGTGRGRQQIDPLAKARKTGGIIAPTENKVTTYDDSSDEE